MIDDTTYQRLRETAWRRRLTEAEQAELEAWLAAHPEARADWQAEVQLNRAIESLRDVPVASNFTARVLQAIEREEAGKARAAAPGWLAWWRGLGWAPKIALAALLVGLGFFAYFHHQAAMRAKLARSIVLIAEIKPLPGPDILADYDVIRRLGQTPPADTELLALLQ